MSQANVELVLRFQPAPDVDLVERFRDDDAWAAFSAALAPDFAADFESANGLLGIEKRYTGMDGLRALWLDWLAPWGTHRVEIERAIDLGEQVLVLANALATVAGSAAQVTRRTGALWTVRDGKVARVEFYPDRAEALKAVGLQA
jgi:ketosteroid isomerase-like protein